MDSDFQVVDLNFNQKHEQALAKIARLVEERDAWKAKYEQVFDEQCQIMSIENSLRARVRDCESSLAKAEAMVEAQREIIKWYISL